MESVLIVDGDRTMSRQLELCLQLNKFNAISVTNVADGLTIADKWRPDFILVDKDFQDTQFMRDIQSKVLEDEIDCKVVMIGSTRKSRKTARGKKSSGVHEYIDKPFQMDDIFSVLRSN